MNAYIVLEARSIEALAIEVNKKIEEGYRPTGGVALQEAGNTDWWYLQAMFDQYALSRE